MQVVGQLLTSGTTSDRRLKNIKSENSDGLEKIRELKVFNYTFKKDDVGTPQVGVIAQDLIKIFPNSVTQGDDGYLRIRWDEMFYALINAVKEIDKKINELIIKITGLDSRIKKLETENALLKKQNVVLIKQISDINTRLNKIEKGF